MRLLLVTMLLAVGGCAEPPPSDTIKIGVMLTYTGDAASIGWNLERGLLLAEHRLREPRADAPPFELVYRDVQGDPDRAARMADELVAEGVVALIGPGSDEVAGEVLPRFEAAGIPVISAVATDRGSSATSDIPWFRLATSVEVLGGNLAATVERQGFLRVNIVRGTDVYHRRFVTAFTEQFVSLGGQVVNEMVVDESSTSFRSEVRAVQDLEDQVEGHVIALDPLPAARFISEVAAISETTPQWFLTPRLKSDVFLFNTPSAGVEGAIGISQDVFIVESAGFVEAFAGEWEGDEPFEATYTMFDSAALTMLAIDAVVRRDEPLDRAHIEAQLFDIARPGGVQLGWQELGDAIGWNRELTNIQYTGVTGPILFAPDGQRRSGRSREWTVHDGQIVNL